MTRQEAFNKVWQLLEDDNCKEAEELAKKYDIVISYEDADEGRIYIDDECMMFDVD